MKILIVDDEPLARSRIREMLKTEGDTSAIAEAANGAEAIASITAQSPDLVFLDIQMPDLDGFQVLEQLGDTVIAQIPVIVFVTAFDEHALRAFKFHALDYLLKPFDRDRFAKTLTRARAQIEKPAQPDPGHRILELLEQMNHAPKYLEWLTVKKNDRIPLIKVANIHWIEAQGNYLRITLPGQTELIRETMDSLESQIDPKQFVRIHRSTIVNVDQIKELQVWRRGEYRVVTHGGKAFTLSGGYRERFDEFLKGRLL